MARDQGKIKGRFSVAIIGDGQTERIYFSDMRDTERPRNLTIFPDYPRRIGSYKGVLERAIHLTIDYSLVFALIDMDKIIRDKQQQMYSQDKVLAEKEGVIVLENNPCFETWLLMHFIHTGRLFKNCQEVSTELKRKNYIPGYEKSERFLVKSRLYNTYKKLIKPKAIPGSKLLEKSRYKQDELYPRAETFKFFEWYFNKSSKISLPV
jgi:hypothetical protein